MFRFRFGTGTGLPRSENYFVTDKPPSQDESPDKAAITLPATVEKIIPPITPAQSEKAQIVVEGAEELYREIRVENTLQDEAGNPVHLKEGAQVEVTIEAGLEATEPLTAGGAKGDRVRSSGAISRILIVDDHPLVRRGTVSFFGSDRRFEICGEACDGKEAVEKALALKPDVILMDVTMPVMNGLDAAWAILRASPGMRIILLTMQCRTFSPFQTTARILALRNP
jgi:CheY-like chemotaxis protein